MEHMAMDFIDTTGWNTAALYGGGARAQEGMRDFCTLLFESGPPGNSFDSPRPTWYYKVYIANIVF